MFDSLSEKLQNIIRSTQDKELTQENMHEALREIRRALLDADVNLRVVKSFISNIRDKAEGENIVQGVDSSQQLVKIVHDELIELLGKEKKPLELNGNPSLIMMLGLQGSGKTTSSAKLAVKLKKEGKNPLLVACDVYRPAAITQLQTLGKEIEVEVFTIPDSKDVQNIVEKAIEHAKNNNYNVLILDTAGRLQIDTDMMAELLLIDRMFNPHEKLLVIDSMQTCLMCDPKIITVGFVSYGKYEDHLTRHASIYLKEALNELFGSKKVTFNDIKNTVRSVVSKYFFRKTQRNPMIIPLVMNKIS